MTTDLRIVKSAYVLSDCDAAFAAVMENINDHHAIHVRRVRVSKPPTHLDVEVTVGGDPSRTSIVSVICEEEAAGVRLTLMQQPIPDDAAWWNEVASELEAACEDLLRKIADSFMAPS